MTSQQSTKTEKLAYLAVQGDGSQAVIVYYVKGHQCDWPVADKKELDLAIEELAATGKIEIDEHAKLHRERRDWHQPFPPCDNWLT